MFDDQGDDEYDGSMGVNDDEEPRVLFDFRMSIAVPEQPKKQPTAPVEVKKGKKTNNKLMDPIGNVKAQKQEVPTKIREQSRERNANKAKAVAKAQPNGGVKQVTPRVAESPLRQLKQFKTQGPKSMTQIAEVTELL